MNKARSLSDERPVGQMSTISVQRQLKQIENFWANNETTATTFEKSKRALLALRNWKIVCIDFSFRTNAFDLPCITRLHFFNCLLFWHLKLVVWQKCKWLNRRKLCTILLYRKSKQMHQQKKRQEKSGSIVLLIALLYVYAQGAQ